MRVLRLAGADDAAAEGDDLARVDDRDHHAVAEIVVAAPVVADLSRPRSDEARVVVVERRFAQPVGRRIAHAETGRDLAGESALLEIVDRLRRRLQLLAVVLGRLRHDLDEIDGARAVVGFPPSAFLFGHLHAGAAGEILHGIDEAHAGIFHHEADGRAVGATAEAVVELLGRADGEGGDFSLWNGQQAA